jgi:hypothetical protein
LDQRDIVRSRYHLLISPKTPSQDTIVDLDSFGDTVINALDDLKAKIADGGDVGSDKDEWMLPSKIFGATCSIKKPEDKGSYRLLKGFVLN